MKKNIKWLLGFSLAAMFVLAGCQSGKKEESKPSKGTISLSYVEWDTEVASTNIVAQVLEKAGYTVKLTPLDNAIMWQSIAKGESDAMVAAWLPNTHGEQYKKYKKDVENLGPNLTGAKVGLVVPSYMKVDKISQLSDEAKEQIIGIEPGSGVVSAAEKAMKKYPNLKNWSLETASSGAMTVALSQAVKRHKEIVVTGWSPHWLFAKYDLKYLEDDKGVFGQGETINTMVRKGFKEDQPEAYRILNNFNWNKKEMEKVMLAINKGADPVEAAKKWVKEHPKEVQSWIEDKA